MIPYQVYKIMHLSGIALILLGLGIILGAFASSSSVAPRLRMTGFIAHGFGLIAVLTGGFGMAARLGFVQGLPGWIYAKIAIWVLLGAAISLTKRKITWGPGLVVLFTVLVGTATGLAIYKPW